MGHFVADLKYKRVYVTSVDALMQAPVWEKARTLRPAHAGEIFHAKKLEADKLEIQMIEAGKLEAVGDLEKKVWRAATYCSCAHRIGTFSLCYVLARDVNLLSTRYSVCGAPEAFAPALMLCAFEFAMSRAFVHSEQSVVSRQHFAPGFFFIVAEHFVDGACRD